MQLKYLYSCFKTFKIPGLFPVVSDFKSMVRFHFLYAAIESGLLDALKTESGSAYTSAWQCRFTEAFQPGQTMRVIQYSPTPIPVERVSVRVQYSHYIRCKVVVQ